MAKPRKIIEETEETGEETGEETAKRSQLIATLAHGAVVKQKVNKQWHKAVAQVKVLTGCSEQEAAAAVAAARKPRVVTEAPKKVA